MVEIIDNKFGKLFPPAMVFAGYIFCFLGLWAMTTGPVLGFPVLLLGIFVGFTFTGVKIVPHTKQFKKYIKIFSFQQGKWESYEKFPYIAVLRKNVSSTAYSRSNRPATTSKETFYEICLLNKTHRKREVIKRLKGKDLAIAEAKKLAKKLELEFTKYNPVMSAKTMRRRQRK